MCITFGDRAQSLAQLSPTNPSGIHFACHSRTTPGPPQVPCGISERNQKLLGFKFPLFTSFHLVMGFLLHFFQLKGVYLVEIFCEVDMGPYEGAVGESFSNLAFEAVEKIISVSCK